MDLEGETFSKLKSDLLNRLKRHYFLDIIILDITKIIIHVDNEVKGHNSFVPNFEIFFETKKGPLRVTSIKEDFLAFFYNNRGNNSNRLTLTPKLFEEFYDIEIRYFRRFLEDADLDYNFKNYIRSLCDFQNNKHSSVIAKNFIHSHEQDKNYNKSGTRNALKMEKLNEIKNRLLKQLRFHYFLDFLIEDIIELKGLVAGTTLFEDAHIYGIEITFETKRGNLKITSLEDDLRQSFYDLRDPNSNTPLRVPNELFEDLYELEIHSLNKFLSSSDLEGKLKEELFQYYIDYWHDYTTGKIRDIIFRLE